MWRRCTSTVLATLWDWFAFVLCGKSTPCRLDGVTEVGQRALFDACSREVRVLFRLSFRCFQLLCTPVRARFNSRVARAAKYSRQVVTTVVVIVPRSCHSKHGFCLSASKRLFSCTLTRSLSVTTALRTFV